jgi:N6-L-threonylcarbamoyladenine synthase
MDAIAVTHGPGLAGSLLVGVNMAKGLAFATGKPLLPVNHLEGHIYSNWVEAPGATPAGDEFPVVVLIVSGGHTELILMTGHGAYRRLGGTLDDAAGEAFDKVARLLNLGFPGGPAIQRAAQQGGDASRFALPRGLRHDERHRFDFSFSGLKTAALNLTKHLANEGADLTEPQLLADLAASFQAAVVDVLVDKTAEAATAYGAARVCICGGVSANAALREAATARFAALGIPFSIPPFSLCTDMIGAAAYYRCMRRRVGMDADANLPVQLINVQRVTAARTVGHVFNGTWLRNGGWTWTCVVSFRRWKRDLPVPVGHVFNGTLRK